MDETRLENALNTLLETTAQISAEQASMKADIAEMKGTMATKAEVAELRYAVTHYGKYVETMLNSFAKSSLDLQDQVAELKQRVSAIEKRLPPQAA